MTLERSDISRLLEVAVVAARLAGQRAMEEIQYAKMSIKNGNEVVTNADPICQEIIINRIKETFPDHGFIAEEGENGQMLLQSPRTTDPIWWIIDPIDGTNNFAHGILNFTVSIAAVYQGQPIIGVVFEPATDSMFSTAKDTDAQLNSSRITTSDEILNEFASFGLDSHFTDDQIAPVIEIMQKTRFRSFGTTALQMAYVAKGSLIGTTTNCAKIWDVAAGAILIENAGGIVTDIKGNNFFPFNPEEYKANNFELLAANSKETHLKLLEMFAGQ